VTGRVEGKVAIITGAGSGIGAAAARRYALEGAAVVCADLKDAQATADAIAEEGGQAIAVDVDVSSQQDTERMVAESLDAFGTVDVLYANAGIAGVGTAMDCTPETWDRVIAVNLTGVWLSMRAVLPVMTERRSGSIVNQASIGGIVGVPGISPYAAAKAGVIGLTKQAAIDFGGHGIRINAIAPGTAPTPLVTETYRARVGDSADAEAQFEEAMRRNVERYPLKRLGTVDDIANLALFLGSDEAAWITCGVYGSDGGMTAA
jgi:NAD(P)-dependent dehydrogenase (short-subunit alcohol dehydrogenase family)